VARANSKALRRSLKLKPRAIRRDSGNRAAARIARVGSEETRGRAAAAAPAVTEEGRALLNGSRESGPLSTGEVIAGALLNNRLDWLPSSYYHPINGSCL